MFFYLRTVILYLVLIVTIRLMGKRQLGQMEPSEFVVTMLVANLASIPMEDKQIPLHYGLIPIATVLVLEVLFSVLALRSIRLRKLLCGKPVILIEKGKLLQENLRRTRVTLDELSGHLREKEVLDIRDVEYAILETNGNLSVFPYPAKKPASAKDAGVQAGKQHLPVTVISDGRILGENLKKAKKDGVWLKKELEQLRTTAQDTYLMTVDDAGHIYHVPREGK